MASLRCIVMPSDFQINIKRAYDKPSLNDGVRVLLESTWPRGLGKEVARLDLWLPVLAPSATLAKWFARNDAAMTTALERRYFAGLRTPQAAAALELIYDYLLRDKTITLLYAGDDPHMTAAALLKDLLEGHRKPPNSTGPAKAAVASGRARAAMRRPRK
jgi:uncharacterized protein YeaO (DUF488 family)